MTDTPSGPRYAIGAVAKLTGIHIDTLRAWERRYGAVTPTRDDRGRLYTDADVARLGLLHDAVSAGHSVGRIAALSDVELRGLVAAQKPAAPTAPVTAPGIDAPILAAALRDLDSVALDQEFSRLAAVLPPITLVRDVLLPLLRDVGDTWHQRPGGIVHERLISSTMRHLLGTFLRLYARRDVPVGLAFATPSGERHEIGILSAAMVAASQGLRVSYLGPDLPAPEVLAAVTSANTRVLVIGLTLLSAHAAIERDLRTLVRGLPSRIELWAGGAGTARHGRLLSPRGLVLPDFDSYVAQVARMAQRAH